MKKVILFLAILSVNLSVMRAQIITIDQDYHEVNFLASDYSAEAISYVHNHSATVRTFRWIRTVEGEPTGWSTTVCDKNLCYSPNTASQSFVLGIDSLGLMKLNIFPAGVSGDATYKILVYDVSDSANANVTMIVNASAQVTGISSVTDPILSIYPIPAKDVLNINLDGSKHLSSVEIYNVVGQKMKTVNVQDGLKSVSIPVSDMKKGVYFLRVLNGDKEITTRTFSKD